MDPKIDTEAAWSSQAIITSRKEVSKLLVVQIELTLVSEVLH